MAIKRNCDLCRLPTPAIADVKLFAGPWAYVCNTHYALRANDKQVTKLAEVN